VAAEQEAARLAQAKGIPDELPHITLRQLKLPRDLKELIATGRIASRKRNFLSRSEALASAITWLLRLGATREIVAALVLDPDHAISSKARAQGLKWTMGDIDRLNCKRQIADTTACARSTPPEGPIILQDPEPEEEAPPARAPLPHTLKELIAALKAREPQWVDPPEVVEEDDEEIAAERREQEENHEVEADGIQ
jgi:hypothetical protein